LVEAAATLEIVEGPVAAELYFWALQVTFSDRYRSTGGAHLGLQWHPPHPGATAANFGGYRVGGGELAGSESSWPSATSNPNTRDFPWQTNRRYRLAVSASSRPGWWDGTVDGLVIRRLAGGGSRLDHLMVWSEVFARCDDPAVTIRWTDLEAVAADGTRHRPDRVTVTYQSGPDGGCANTDVALDGVGIVQRTNGARGVPHGTTLALP